MSSAGLGSRTYRSTALRLLMAALLIIGHLAVLAPAAFAAPVDFDQDGWEDFADNCPAVANPSQTDVDGDGLGAACDTNDSDPDV